MFLLHAIFRAIEESLLWAGCSACPRNKGKAKKKEAKKVVKRKVRK